MFINLLKYLIIALAVFVFCTYALKKSIPNDKRIYLSIYVFVISMLLDNVNFSKNRALAERFTNFQRQNPATVYSKDLIQISVNDSNVVKYMNRNPNTSLVMMSKPSSDILSNLTKLRLFKAGKADQLNPINYNDEIEIHHNSLADRVGASTYRNMPYVIGYGAENKLLSHEAPTISRKLFVVQNPNDLESKQELKYGTEVFIKIAGADPNTYLKLNDDGSISGTGSKDDPNTIKFKIDMIEPALLDDSHLSIRINEYIF